MAYSMMNKIQEIDKAITINVDNIKEQIGKLSFETICDFKPNKIHIPEIPWGSLNYPGIYLIEIKNDNKFDSFKPWIEDFKFKWENEKYLRHFTPNLKKKRIVKHNELKEWMPLYIGKSRRIEGRVHEHIY